MGVGGAVPFLLTWGQVQPTDPTLPLPMAIKLNSYFSILVNLVSGASSKVHSHGYGFTPWQ